MNSGDQIQIRNVIQQLKADTQVYQNSVNISQSTTTKDVLNCIIKAREFACNYLQTWLDQHGTEATLHAFGSVLHKMYPDMLSRLPADTAPEFLEPLKQAETSTFHAMQTALDSISDSTARMILMDLNPRLNGHLKNIDMACGL